MTGVALAINASAGSPSYSARQFRNALAGMKGWDGVPLAGRQGIRPMGGTAANVVTLSGSTITINLHAGEITPGWAAVTGTYDVALTVVETQSLTPADGTNPRKDIVIGRVYDHDESASGLRLYRSEYIAGLAGPTPSEPSVPQGAIRLATIDVPQTGGGSPVVTNNYLMSAASGGVLPVRTQAERDALVTPYNGQTVHRMDKGWQEHHDGTAWRVYPNAVSFAATSEFTGPVTGQVAFHLSTRQWWYYNGTTWIADKLAAQQQATGYVTTTSATYVALSGDPGIAFVAPVSGQIWVDISAAAVPEGAGTTSRAAFQVRTGGSIGSGTIVYTVDDGDSIANASFANWEAGRRALVTGLTPGTTYNVQMLYRRDGATALAGFARRRISVDDA